MLHPIDLLHIMNYRTEQHQTELAGFINLFKLTNKLTPRRAVTVKTFYCYYSQKVFIVKIETVNPV